MSAARNEFWVSQHEVGHGIFGLSDEYCCDGGFMPTTAPHINLFADQASCEASALAHGVDKKKCTHMPAPDACPSAVSNSPYSTNGKWRMDDDDAMRCGGELGIGGGDYGLLDQRRVRWFLNHACLNCPPAKLN